MVLPCDLKANEQKIQELKRKRVENKSKKIGNAKDIIRYEHDHKIKYFAIEDKTRRAAHVGCCKLFKGANPKQQIIIDNWHDTSKRIFCLTGSDKFGKTTMGVVLVISLLIGYWPWDPKKTPISNPPVIVRWIGQDWAVHIKTVLEPMLDEWWPKDFGVKTLSNLGVKATWNCENKSILYLLSNRQDPAVHAGKDPHYVLYDEPPEREIYIENARGLSATTDDPPGLEGRTFISASLIRKAWMHREIIKRRNPDGTPDRSVFNVHGEIYDNEGYGMTAAGIAEYAKNLKPEEKQVRLYGKPGYMQGLIYPQFDREIHLKKRFKIPLNYLVNIAIDCHPAKENAVLFWAIHPANYIYICDEIWMHGDGTDIADEIIRRITRNAYNVNAVLIDHSAKGDKNQKATTFKKIEDVLFRHKLMLETYRKDEDGGIKTVRNLLLGPNNEPSLFVFDDLPVFIRQIEGYMWDPKTNKPVDDDNDMMDNAYALANKDTQWFSTEDTGEEDYEEPEKPVSDITGY